MLDMRFDDTTTHSLSLLFDLLKLSLKQDTEAQIIALEKYCAELFSKEAAIFLSSCSVANIVALCALTDQTGGVLFDKQYFINRFGIDHIKDLCKVTPVICESADGFISTEIVEQILKDQTKDSPAKLKCVFIENTVNGTGGLIFPLDKLKALDQLRQKYGIKIHMDGARITSASIASKISFATYGQYVDSICLSFTKGLGAPYGAVLVGSAALIEKAKVYRKWFGSPVRSWLLAGAAMYCIRYRLEKLEFANNLTKLLYLELSKIQNLKLQEPQTNILLINVTSFGISPAEFVRILESKYSIKVLAWDKQNIRIILTPENTEDQIKLVASAVKKLCFMLQAKIARDKNLKSDAEDKELSSMSRPKL